MPTLIWDLIVQSFDSDRSDYRVKPGKMSIGRNPDNDVVVEDPAASRYHAELEFDIKNKRLIIADLGSTNGTYVNGKRTHSSKRLEHGDQMRIGHHLLTVVSKDSDILVTQKTRPLDNTGNFNDLVIHAIDQFTVLLHDLSDQLNKIKDFASAKNHVTNFLGRTLRADNCGVILIDEFNYFIEQYNLKAFVEHVETAHMPIIVSNNSQKIISNVTVENMLSNGIGSLILTPVLVDHEIIALIYALKDSQAGNPFEDLDLQLAVGVSHYTGLTFQRLLYDRALERSANYDLVTGLPNRKLLLEHLTRAIARTKRQKKYSFALFFIDLDNFKQINDTLGHATGDYALVAVAERLQSNFRAIDTVSRFGGDEFAIIYDDIRDVGDALSVVHRLIESMSEPFEINGKKLKISLSIGIALSTKGYDFAEDIINDADIAMYKTKEDGETSFRVYDEQLHAQMLDSLRLQTKLKEAYKLKEFLLKYQPIVDLAAGNVVGFEALIRWDSSEKGLLTPGQFMSSIQTTGLLNSIERWVLDEACAQISRLNMQFGKDSPLYLSVNLSNKQLRHPNIVELIQENLVKYEIEPGQLWIEISEKTNIGNEEVVMPILETIRSLGVQLCLDDFGTGYSTFSYLYRLPISILKIDRSFIADVNESHESNRVIQTIIGLAANLGLKLVAEGVETQAQLDFLKSVRCDYAQGYFLSEPLFADRVYDILRLKVKE